MDPSPAALHFEAERGLAMRAKLKCYTRRCRHFIGVTQPDGTEEPGRVACKAFPDGIPEEIAYGDDPHLYFYPGDSGIHYEPTVIRKLSRFAEDVIPRVIAWAIIIGFLLYVAEDTLRGTQKLLYRLFH